MKTKTILLILIITTLFTSCKFEKYKKYTLEYEIEVKYNNNTIDTLSGTLFDNYESDLKIYINKGEVVINGGSYTIASYAQSFRILNEKIYLTDQNK